ncbi:hypothetical protein Cs7R123_32530 [Catellatospora sp. TT07R-123]|uniref:pyridoxal-phosphate dependent enzyme n=1 Tax=Catellatospora sp. TT07R-123 TaxID=2733863 RepID=UPI001B035B24|nr:pyridoxal-phosphate dependent enzyme [Catellatospora sp. TT07R-123]GHJ45911.1 hypothetical protein Cs7R123_32530 [Catellatospora sp. TT07R-123]
MTQTTGRRSAFDVIADQVDTARTIIAPYVVNTPTIRLPWLDTPDGEVWAKLECWQRSGSVKARSAFHALLSLDPAQRFVTAPGGNHGLAIAEAARILGHSCVAFVPINASAVRTRRIRELGAHVEVAGADGNDATSYAVAYAQRHSLPFLPSSGDLRAAVALATCAAEAFEDAGPFDNLIVPLGSGTLLAGCGEYATAAVADIRLAAVHPAVFRRPFGQLPLTNCLAQAYAPTLADSLAVLTPDPHPLAEVLNRLSVALHEVDEPTIALGVFALLHRQNLLVEGAAAAAVGALMTPPGPSTSGRSLVVLTGSNINSSDVARAFTTDIPDPNLRRRLGLRRRTPVLSRPPTLAQQLPATHGDRSMTATPPNLPSAGSPPRSQLDAAASVLTAHRRYVQDSDLRVSPVAHEALDVVLSIAQRLRNHVASNTTEHHEDELRLLHRLTGFIHQSMEWASPAHDQSQRINFFDPAAQMPDIANYARYGNAALLDLELCLAEMLGFANHDVELLATSSGMAAYQLIESYLLRHVLQPGDTVACTPYIYFEAREQLTSLPFVRHVQAASFHPSDLVQIVEQNDARVLFVDPVANIAGLPSVDLRELASITVGNPAWSDRWLVIDGTMVSGGIDIFRLFPPGTTPRALYYESASKYAQLGLDLQMAGVCVIPTALSTHLRLQRRNTGTVLYPEAVARFPRADRETFLDRMQTMSANASAFAHSLRLVPWLGKRLAVGVVDDWTHNDWSHGGGVVTLKFHETGLNNRDVLESLIERLMKMARLRGIPLVRGVSFGLSTTRVSATSSTAEFHDPFLRFSIGTEATEKVGEMADILTETIAQHLDVFAHRPLPTNRAAI